MGKIGTGFSMSLDGFVAGPNDEVERVFSWMFSGDTDFKSANGDREMALKMPEASVKIMEEAVRTTGALVTGRRLFEFTQGWGGKHPLNVPIVVVTHNAPPEWVTEGAPFTFVRDGVESAIEQAQKIAGDKAVAVASPSIVQ